MDFKDSNKNEYSMENLHENGEENNQINPSKQKENSENKNKTKIQKNEENKYSNKDINNNPKNQTQNDNKDNNMDKYMFNNIIKIKKENSSSQKLLDEQWEHQKILLDYNILDFTCKNYYVYIIKYIYLYI